MVCTIMEIVLRSQPIKLLKGLICI